MGLKKQNRDLHVHHAFWFWYISFPSLHNYDVKCLISLFVEDAREHKTTTFFFFFLHLHTVLSNSTPEKINAFNKFNEIE